MSTLEINTVTAFIDSIPWTWIIVTNLITAFVVAKIVRNKYITDWDRPV